MELPSEMYSWLIDLGVLELSLNARVENNLNVYIPKTSLNLLFDAHSFEKILLKLEEQYNMFYDVHLHYSKNFKNMSKGLSNNDNLYNWNIISESINAFGFELTKEKVDVMLNTKNTKILSEILNNLFNLSQELTKRNKEIKPIKQVNVEHKSDEAINIESIDLKKNIKETDSIIIFYSIIRKAFRH